MKNLMKVLLLATAGLSVGCTTSTTTAEHQPRYSSNNVMVAVNWDDLDSFDDIDAGTSAKHNFRKSMVLEIERHLTSLAEQLPKDHRLYVVINNIDLAGEVDNEYWRSREALRTYEYRVDPIITFTYRLKNAQGEFIAAQDKLKLVDTHDGKYPNKRFMVHPFAYEKYLLKDWFETTLIPYVEQASNS